ncbi:TPA_asm: P3 [Bouteloa betacytorhabdovirus 1]|nr:TPA_asm: P3 [Bouteloa betacytorhabdovirus 1]
MEIFQFNKSSKLKVEIKSNTHNSDIGINFTWAVSDLLNKKRYAKLEELTFKYTALIKSQNHGQITISVVDKRKTLAREAKVVNLELLSSISTEAIVGGFEWMDHNSACPLKLHISVNVLGIRAGTKIGELKVIPRFKYTNEEPDFSGVTMLVDPRAPSLGGQSPVFYQKLGNGGISGMVTNPDAEILRNSAVVHS